MRDINTIKKAAVAAAVFGLLLSNCSEPPDRESLRWRSSVDIPINVELIAGSSTAIDRDVFPGKVIMDLAWGEFALDEGIFIIKKFEDIEVDYWVSLENNTGYDLTFYALFAPEDAEPQINSIDLFDAYKLATEADVDSLLDMDIINMLGTGGLAAPDGEISVDSANIARVGEALKRIIVSGEEPVIWRWLAKISASDYEGIRVGDAKPIDARVRLRISGINNLDSLFTSF